MPRKNSPVKARQSPGDVQPEVLIQPKNSEPPSFLVTLRLGEALRRVKRPKVFLNLREGVVSIRGELSAHDTNSAHPKSLSSSNAGAEPPQAEIATQPDPHNSSDSEIEILEVRPARKRKYYNPGSDPNVRTKHPPNASQSYYTDSELSSLDDEINEALSNHERAETKATQASMNAKKASAQALFIPFDRSRSPPPSGYRNIPPNLMNAFHREINVVFDGTADDDIEVVGKRTFSLKDPIARTKIKLPIKATTCRHFECFDLANFCLFYKLPPGTRGGLRRSLVMQSREARETEQLFLRQQQQIQSGRLSSKAPGLVYPNFSDNGQMFFTDLYSRTPPLYKCPLCDEKFGLKQLYISDIFNFFVKTTPAHATKIMLVDNDRYKIVEEEKDDQPDIEQDIVDLSGDEDEESEVKLEKKSDAEKEQGKEIEEGQKTQQELPQHEAPDLAHYDPDKSLTADDFNDGLDGFLASITHGDGSWENPMTLD